MPKGVPNKRYTPEFKKLVVETMLKEKLSYCETARQFEVSDYKQVMIVVFTVRNSSLFILLIRFRISPF